MTVGRIVRPVRAVLYHAFQGSLELTEVPDPTPPPDGVVVRVRAAGLCRSDWHGWMGHDPDIRVPHVPGHELAGEVVATGAQVRRRKTGDRVTVPFCLGCGRCHQCLVGDQQICDAYYQPGFTGWGAFAEYVALPHADGNLVALPEALDFAPAAILGCRFVTAYRAVNAQGRLRPGEWLAVHGCGGVGLSAVMIARAGGARVAAVDVNPAALSLARELGADITIDASATFDVPAAIVDATDGGAHVSLDAVGSAATCVSSVRSLRKRGRHVQVGLLTGSDTEPPVPMGLVIARELELVGSHGMQAHRYGEMLRLVAAGLLPLDRLIGRRIALADVVTELPRLGKSGRAGVTVAEW